MQRVDKYVLDRRARASVPLNLDEELHSGSSSTFQEMLAGRCKIIPVSYKSMACDGDGDGRDSGLPSADGERLDANRNTWLVEAWRQCQGSYYSSWLRRC